VVAKVSQFDPVDSPVNRDSGFCVTEFAMPFQIDIFAIWSQVMADFVHSFIFVYKRK